MDPRKTWNKSSTDGDPHIYKFRTRLAKHSEARMYKK
jgi:hypothetical protein